MIKIDGYVKADNQDDALDQQGTADAAKRLLEAVPGVSNVRFFPFDEDWENGGVVLALDMAGEGVDAMVAAVRQAGWKDGIGDIDWMDYETVDE